MDKFHLMKFTECGITESEIEETLMNAELALSPFLGILARRNKIKIFVFLAVFVLCVILAIIAGYVGSLRKRGNARWFWPVFILAIYLIGVFVV